MGKVKSKLLLVVLAIMLCFMPMFMFGGCDGVGNAVELNNVATVSVHNYYSGYKSYIPYQNKVWLDKENQRLVFYTGSKDTLTGEYSNFTKYDIPSIHCTIIYQQTDKI